MTQPRSRPLHFDVSSGLKSVLGSELITNDQVAVFELVKNSFDADAKRVHIYFGDQSIIVADNGKGMSYHDIKTKWLFVAYSSKREGNNVGDYRDDVLNRQHFAGSKGIGRFSSDRLGETVKLQTRQQAEVTGPVHTITVDWNLFDENHIEHFENIAVIYRAQPDGFVLPSSMPKLKYGTVIEITNTRKKWGRDEILELKSALAKLINPFGAKADGFRITVYAPAEQKRDNEERVAAERKKEELWPNALVNGDVGNFIFSTLQEKTTFIELSIDSEGRYIESALMDRGELIYKIREPNKFELLKPSGFRCQIFFLNQSAKLTFARRMGLASVQFGSVFLFRNGFRVFPVGEEGDDWFGMDRRKQQGYARFLGTRDVIGRIDVVGNDHSFQEASSRNDGLIESPAVDQLKECFWKHGLLRLERYVVPVTFVDKEDKNVSDVTRLMTDPGRARVTSAVAKLVDNDEIELLEYSTRLIGILDERSSQFEESLSSLRAIAEKTKDSRLYKKIEQAEQRFEELRRGEAEARRQADEEREAKETAQARAVAAEAAVSSVVEKLEEEKKRNLFLSSIASLDTDTIQGMHHQVTIYAVGIQQKIENFMVKISSKQSIASADVVNVLEQIAFLNRKVMGVSKFATKANFRMESEKIKGDLADYIVQYINGVAKDFLLGPMVVDVSSDEKGFEQSFKPIDVSVVIDNLISNAKKARATTIHFIISHPTRSTLHIDVTDDGRGFHNSIDDLGRIFEKGFTKTDGSGLGLFHVRHVLGEMGGTIEAESPSTGGTSFHIRISK
jgi:signal transduction histidine kinase